MATSILKNWCIWIAQVTPDRRKYSERFGIIRSVAKAELVSDYKLRWLPGNPIRTSALVGFDLQNMRVVT